jgi:hypothetical protein
MPEEQVTKHDLEMLSAGAHTAESFGRAVVASALAAAAETGEMFAVGHTIKIPQVTVSVTPIRGVGVWMCVEMPGKARVCKLERNN